MFVINLLLSLKLTGMLVWIRFSVGKFVKIKNGNEINSRTYIELAFSVSIGKISLKHLWNDSLCSF